MQLRALPLLILPLLAGCFGDVKPTVPPKIVYVTVKVPVPVDKRLTEPCPKVMPTNRTVEEAVKVAGARGKSLDDCNVRMTEIRNTH
jgi:hypothetical protein